MKMASRLETFHLFQDEAIAMEFAEVLNSSGIECRIASTPRILDNQIAGVDSTPDYSLKIKAEDFERANNILDAFFEKQLAEVDKDYFIFSFSTEELKDVIKKPDEWGRLNYLLAKKILAERGHTISEDALGKLKQERKKELSVTESPGIFLYIIAWFLIFGSLVFLINQRFREEDFIRPFMSIFSFFIGRHIYNFKKIMPDGESLYGYHEKDRSHGLVIRYIALVIIMISLLRLISDQFT